MYNQKDEKCQERSEFYRIQKAKKQQKSKERKDQKEKYNIRKIHLFFRERGKYNQINIKIKKI